MKPQMLKYCPDKPKAKTILFLLLIFPFSVFSQVNDGSFAYYNALNLYNEGRVDSAHSILNSCINNKNLLRGTSKNTKIEIFRLDALSCLLLDKPEEARLKIRNMLAFQPYYKNNYKQGDLSEFKSIVNNYSTQPQLVIGAYYFQDISLITLDKAFTQHVYDGTHGITGYGSGGLGLSIENRITKRISLGLGFRTHYLSILYKGGNVPLASDNTYWWEWNYFEIPIFANFQFRIERKIKPYVQLAIIGKYRWRFYGAYKINSPEFGSYYLLQQNPGVLAVFMNKYEAFDFLIGSGFTINLKKFCFDFNMGYLPQVPKTNHLSNVEDINILPSDELFRKADEIIVLDLRLLRFTVGLKYFIKYKAY